MSNNKKQKDVAGTADIILATLVVFLGAHLLLSSVGLIPSEVSAFNNQVAQSVQSLHTIEYKQDIDRPKESAGQKHNQDLPSDLPEAPQGLSAQRGEKPQRITIDEIGVDTEVANPEKASLSVLNDALDKSAVRYPESGRINSDRPMFLFGHSSRLPVVQNQAYKSFNGLNELSVGDEITVQGSSTKAIYAVTSVDVTRADEGFVSFQPNQEVDLTISTCTTFGAKQNRTIVRAKKI
jgi:LPXTG-site transpeptidase (sortase) family protein